LGFLKPDLFTRRCGVFRSAGFAKDGQPVAEGPVAPLSLFLVRDHPHDLFKVCVAYKHGTAEMFLALLRLRGQDVAQVRFVPLYLSRPGFLEALGSTFVCF
jgi:hypothetical protein